MLRKINLLAVLLLGLSTICAQEIEEAARPEAGAPNPERIVRFQNGNLYGFRGFFSEKVYVEPRFEQLANTYSNCMEARLNGKMGLIDGSGKTLVPFEFNKIVQPVTSSAAKQRQGKNNYFSWFLAKKDGRWGGIDSTGKTVQAFEWERAFFVNDTIAVLARDGLLQLIGPDGQVYLNEKVDSWSWANPDNFHRTLLIKIQKGENIGVLDERGHVVVPLQYRNLRWFVDGLLCLEDAARQQVIFNRQGREVVPKQTAEMYYAGRGLFMVVKNRELGKSGMVDSTGQTVLPFEYAECRIIQEDNAFTYSPFLMTRRLKQRLYAMHALDGRPLTEALYTDARWSSFAPGLLFVQLPDNTWRMLGEEGRLMHEDAFDQIDRSGRAIIGSKNNVGQAFFRLDGTQVTDFLYSSARGLTNDYQATEFARRLGLDSYLKLLGEASRTGKPQVFIDIEGRELILPKEK